MPDWRRLVARRLRWATLPRARRDEIERELAGFLEDSYERELGAGASRRAAVRGAIGSVGGWAGLTRALEHQEGEMRTRMKALWVPGLVVALVALALSRLPHVKWGGFSMVRLESGQMIGFVWSWMLMLPLVGALGAEWSRRQGGSRRQQVLVALAPAFALLVIYALTFVLLGRPAPQYPTRGPIPGRLMFFVNLVLIPTLPLLLGCLPALTRRRRGGNTAHA